MFWICALAGGLVLALQPRPALPFAAGDLELHAFAGAALVLMAGLFDRRRRAWHIAALALGAGLLVELAQGLVPHRAMELRDLVGDALGIGAGSLLLTALRTLARSRPAAV